MNAIIGDAETVRHLLCPVGSLRRCAFHIALPMDGDQSPAFVQFCPEITFVKGPGQDLANVLDFCHCRLPQGRQCNCRSTLQPKGTLMKSFSSRKSGLGNPERSV